MATDLITKLEEAGEGSRELDVDVTLALGLWTPPARSERTSADVWKRDSVNHYCQHTPVTQSLDAALALAERLGLDVPQLLNDALEGPGGLWARGWRSDRPLTSQIATALCAAILRASEDTQS